MLLQKPTTSAVESLYTSNGNLMNYDGHCNLSTNEDHFDTINSGRFTLRGCGLEDESDEESLQYGARVCQHHMYRYAFDL